MAVFAQALLGRQALAPGDGYQSYLPWYSVAAAALRGGQVPGWNPFVFAGSPLLASHQAGVFYPPNWLMLLLPTLEAFNLIVVSHYVLAGVGAWALARHLTGDLVGAAVAGVAFGLCGFMFAHLGHTSMIATAAWLPWTLLAFERLRSRPSAGRLFAAAACFALALFAGHAQLFFTIVAAVGLYALGMCLVDGRPSLRPILLAGAAIVAGMALGAVQLLPILRFVGETNRSVVSYDEAMTYSLPLSHGFLFFFPYLFGNAVPTAPFDAAYTGVWNLTEMTAYSGIAAGVLAAAGLGVLRRDRRFAVLAGTAAVMTLLAFGRSTPLSRLVHALPVYGQFRSWARYAVVFDLAVAVFAAAGVAAAALAASRLAPLRSYLGPEGVDPLALLIPLTFALVGGVGALAVWRRPNLAGVLVPLVALDAVVSFGWFYEWRLGAPPVEVVREDEGSRRAAWGKVLDQPGGLDRYLFVGADVGAMGRDFVSVTDYRGLLSANGASPLAPVEYLEAVGHMSPFGSVGDPEAIWRPQSRLLDLLRVTTVLVEAAPTYPKPPSGGLLAAVQPAPPGPQARVMRYEYRPKLPDVFVVGSAEIRERERVLAALDGRETFDPAGVALVEASCPCPIGATPGRAGTVQRRRFEANRVVVDLEATRAGMLVVSQAWMMGWRATVDGRPAPVVRVDGV
ncbi:MAG: hypothetical protein ACRDV9_07585, partial [Acidimicrobiia bacterium]